MHEGKSIAKTYFGGHEGEYMPSLIEEIDEKHGTEYVHGLLPRHYFTDGSWIETYGNEIVSVHDAGEED